jgi:hypothetical protein
VLPKQSSTTITKPKIEKINEVKLKHRSSLKLEDWQKDRYYEKSEYVCDRILNGLDPNFKDTIERVHID